MLGDWPSSLGYFREDAVSAFASQSGLGRERALRGTLNGSLVEAVLLDDAGRCAGAPACPLCSELPV